MQISDVVLPSFSHTKHYAYFLTSWGKGRKRREYVWKRGASPLASLKGNKCKRVSCMEVRETFGGEDNNLSPSLDQQHVRGKESIVP